MRRISAGIALVFLFSSAALAGEELKGRAEINWRYGDERSVLTNEFWMPVHQDYDRVLYADLRLMRDDQDNHEGNLGIGYRQTAFLPLLGEGVAGGHAWLDRRITQRGSAFHQVAAGAEWLGDSVDLRLNGYFPLSGGKEYSVPNASPQGPVLAGTGIFVDTDATLLEEPQHGLDMELGWNAGRHFDFVNTRMDSLRLYGGGYYFNGEHTREMLGWRMRFTADITQDVQAGARFQRDDERGSQGFLEATVRFPFGHKKSYRLQGVRARLDESPERDVDIVTGDVLADPGDRVPVLNRASGQEQEILHVDNSAPGGGDGSAENPFNALADAQAAASAYTIIYVKRGDGTDTNQDQGIVLDKTGQRLVGSGTDFVYDSRLFVAANGADPVSSILVAPATAAPVISNTNVNGDGVRISADDVAVMGVEVAGANRDGIVVEADGAAASAQGIEIRDVTVRGNRTGLYIHGADGGSVSVLAQDVSATTNSQHGIAVYDDTASTFEVDLGGGSLGSAGRNILAGNTLEDLAVDYDGHTLAAQNNWWGQMAGPVARNIYYGAPLNDSLVMNWTFDDGTAADRSGNGYDGMLVNAPAPGGGVMDFNGPDGEYIDGVDVDESDNGNELTVLFFVTPETLVTTQTFLSKWEQGNAGNQNSWGIRTTNADAANLLFFLSDNPDAGNNFFASTDAALAVGQTAHVAFVYDGAGAANADRLVAYKNGVQLNGNYTGTIPATLTDTAEPVRAAFPLIGNPAFAQPHDGTLDDIRIYNRVLDSSEIAEIYRMNTSSAVNTNGFLTVIP